MLIGALAWPLLFTGATFNEDWLNHLWYLWHQSHSIGAERLPSLFLESSDGIFYPLYAFYGGTLYAVAGYLSLALGDAPLQAYILTYLLDFAAAYGGWLWLSRMFGLRAWPAHVPGIVFVTSAPYLMLIYALGDWPELTAVSMMPLVTAAGLSVLRADRLRVWPGLALAASCVLFFGSHLLTLIWGSTVLVLVAGALLLCVPGVRRGMTLSGPLRVAAIVLPALAVNAWFLLPTIAYEAHTKIAGFTPEFDRVIHETSYFVSLGNLFGLSRSTVPGATVYTALPALAMAWTLVSVVGSWRARRRGTWLRVFLILAVASALLIAMMTHVGLILALPRLYASLQFSFRLESYVLLCASGAMLAALVLARDGGRWSRAWVWALVPLAIFSVAGALAQVDGYPHGLNRRLALSSYLTPTFEQQGLWDYVDQALPTWLGRPLPTLLFAPDSLRDGRTARHVREPPGQLLETNIRGGPELVAMTGARIVGISHEGYDVVEIDRPAVARAAPGAHDDTGAAAHDGGARRGSGADTASWETVAVAPARPVPVLLGRALSALGVAIIALELLWAATRGVRRDRAQKAGTR